MRHVVAKLGVSIRRACRVVGLARESLRYKLKRPEMDKPLIRDMRRLANEYPGWGYKKIWKLLRDEGWVVNKKRVWRLWRQEGLCIERKPRKPRHKGVEDNACHVRKAEMVNQAWSVDFVCDQTEDGRKLKILTVVDDWSREALAVEVARKMGHKDVGRVLKRLFEERGMPQFIRSDNGSEFVAKELQKALGGLGVDSAFVAPGSPWQNGRNERLNGILRYELLDRQIFATLAEARVLHDKWRRVYNEKRPHGAIGFMTPSAFAQHERQRGAVYRGEILSDSH